MAELKVVTLTPSLKVLIITTTTLSWLNSVCTQDYSFIKRYQLSSDMVIKQNEHLRQEAIREN